MIRIRFPSDNEIPYTRYLRAIMEPLKARLEAAGHKVEYRSALDGRYDSATDDLTIWMVSKIAEGPIGEGKHLLWYLDRMKIVPPAVLRHYDAILTASFAHREFLKGLIEGEKEVFFAGWPIDWDAHKPAPQAHFISAYQPILRDWLDIVDYSTRPDWIKAQEFKNGLGHITDQLARSVALLSPVRLRERHTGFLGFEGAFILGLGGVVFAPSFRSTPEELMPALRICQTAPTYRDELDRLKRVERQPEAVSALFIREHHSVDATANALDAAINAAHAPKRDVEPKRTRPQEELSSEGKILLEQANAILEKRRFEGRVITDFFAENGAPYDDPALVEAAKALVAWPDPGFVKGASSLWRTVATASCETEKHLKAVSRRLNGHNLYAFSSRNRKRKELCRPFVAGMPIKESVKHGSIGVFVHAYYLDNAISVLRAIQKHLPAADIYVSTDTQDKRNSIRSSVRSSRIKIAICPNVGRDIYPKIFHFGEENLRYSLVLHLHTKQSPHSYALRKWRRHNFRTLLSGRGSVARALQAFARDPKLGMLYPDPPTIIQPAMAWTRNRRVAEILAQRLGWSSLPSDPELDFPAGSMFWARPKAIEPLLKLPLDAADFPPECGQEDGTVAHAVERLLGVSVFKQGYRMRRLPAKVRFA